MLQAQKAGIIVLLALAACKQTCPQVTVVYDDGNEMGMSFTADSCEAVAWIEERQSQWNKYVASLQLEADTTNSRFKRLAILDEIAWLKQYPFMAVILSKNGESP